MISELVKLTLKYSNVGTMRRIGYILEKNGLPKPVTQKLKFKVDGGTSLIPLVPTKPARGTIDREWGIIDNL
jgi:predicted transcriptional regulator of viral defense system